MHVRFHTVLVLNRNMMINDAIPLRTNSPVSFFDAVNVRVYTREGLHWKALNETKRSEGLQRKAPDASGWDGPAPKQKNEMRFE